MRCRKAGRVITGSRYRGNGAGTLSASPYSTPRRLAERAARRQAGRAHQLRKSKLYVLGTLSSHRGNRQHSRTSIPPGT